MRQGTSVARVAPESSMGFSHGLNEFSIACTTALVGAPDGQAGAAKAVPERSHSQWRLTDKHVRLAIPFLRQSNKVLTDPVKLLNIPRTHPRAMSRDKLITPGRSG